MFFFLYLLLLLLFFLKFYFICFVFYFVCVCVWAYVCVWWSEGCGVMSRYNCVKANEVTPPKQTANPCAPLRVPNL